MVSRGQQAGIMEVGRVFCPDEIQRMKSAHVAPRMANDFSPDEDISFATTSSPARRHNASLLLLRSPIRLLSRPSLTVDAKLNGCTDPRWRRYAPRHFTGNAAITRIWLRSSRLRPAACLRIDIRLNITETHRPSPPRTQM